MKYYELAFISSSFKRYYIIEDNDGRWKGTYGGNPKDAILPKGLRFMKFKHRKKRKWN